MSESIDFSRVHTYNTLKSGITIGVILSDGSESVECEAKVDTGFSHCIFKRSHGELLGIEIESVDAVSISTMTGRFTAFPHRIELDVLNIRTESIVYFAADDFLSRNVLGRMGWLDRVKLGLIDYEGKMFLGPYE